MIIIRESSNLDNWSLYGYTRDTTEPPDKLVAAAPQNFQVLNVAYSTEPFTIQSLTKLLIFAVDQDEQHFVKGPDIFQVAERYGFKTSWLSNQPKGEGRFAAIANTFDHQTFINNLETGEIAHRQIQNYCLILKRPSILLKVHPIQL